MLSASTWPDAVARSWLTGNEENVGAFMQALGYDFRADPVGDADGLLFKRALRITHPDQVWQTLQVLHRMQSRQGVAKSRSHAGGPGMASVVGGT